MRICNENTSRFSEIGAFSGIGGARWRVNNWNNSLNDSVFGACGTLSAMSVVERKSDVCTRENFSQHGNMLVFQLSFIGPWIRPLRIGLDKPVISVIR